MECNAACRAASGSQSFCTTALTLSASDLSFFRQAGLIGLPLSLWTACVESREASREALGLLRSMQALRERLVRVEAAVGELLRKSAAACDSPYWRQMITTRGRARSGSASTKAATAPSASGSGVVHATFSWPVPNHKSACMRAR